MVQVHPICNFYQQKAGRRLVVELAEDLATPVMWVWWIHVVVSLAVTPDQLQLCWYMYLLEQAQTVPQQLSCSLEPRADPMWGVSWCARIV